MSVTDRESTVPAALVTRVTVATDCSGSTRIHARSPPSAEELIKAGPQVETA